MRPALLLATSLLSLGCAPERECGAAVWYVDPSATRDTRVSVVGPFNGWDPDADPLDPVRDGAWHTRLDLPPGDHPYALRVGSVELRDPFAPLLTTDPVTGDEVSMLRVEDCRVPTLALESARATADGRLDIAATFLRGQGSGRLVEATATLGDGATLAVDTHPRTGSVTARTAGLAPGKHTVHVAATDGDGQTASLRVPLWVEPEPFAWEDALIYQIMVDRFAGPDGAQLVDPGDPAARFGGTLAGITAVLESGYFDTLGVRALWLSPLYRNPEGRWGGANGHTYSSYHGYWPISPREVEPRLGTDDDVHTLVAAAHARGIRVILDVVPNHVHEDHPYRTAHPGPPWFNERPDCVCGTQDCPWSTEQETCWFTPYLPDLDWSHPAVARTVTADTIAWATRFDLDGFRVDAVPMLTRPAVREIVYGVRGQLGDDFLLLGETFTSAAGIDSIRANLGPHGLDGQFDFPVMWALRDFVATEAGDATDLAEALAASERAWSGSGSVMAPFIGNHDTDRFLSVAAFDDTSRPWVAPPPQPDEALPYRKLVMAQALVLSLPGAPVIYYGDELGLAGAHDPDCRRAMPLASLTDHQRWALERVGRLGRARRCVEALRHGARQTLVAEGNLFAQVRHGAAPAVLVLNASDDAATLDLPDLGVAGWHDVVEQEDLAADQVPVAPWSARLLVSESCAEVSR